MSTFTGTVPTILAGYVPSGDDWASILSELTALSAAWSTWSPTMTNLTLGNGTSTARYRQVGKTVDFYWDFVLGSSSAVGSSPSITLPVAMASYLNTTLLSFPAQGAFFDTSSGARRQVSFEISSATVLAVNHWNATPTSAVTTATVPWTWATGDSMRIWGTYEAA